MLKRKIVGILQARMGSSRFPGKSLIDIDGEPLLKRIINLQKNCRLLDEYYVATSDLKIDDQIEALCIKLGVKYYRGSEKNVLQRFIDISDLTKADIIVRLTGDNPFVDEDMINFVLEEFLIKENFIKYACASTRSGFPYGMSVDVFLANELNKYRNTIDNKILEHVTYEMKKIIKNKNILLVESPIKCINAKINLTIDYAVDLKFIFKLIKSLNKKNNYNYIDVLKMCNEVKL